ncbi:hypothetical protein V6Z11_A04G036200 [Gossypium hirsutum]
MADPSFYHPPPLLLISILFLPGIALDHYLPISKIQPFLNCLQTSQRLINCKQGGRRKVQKNSPYSYCHSRKAAIRSAICWPRVSSSASMCSKHCSIVMGGRS